MHRDFYNRTKDLSGGAEGNRTLDLMNAIHALSQLSYGPVIINFELPYKP